MNDNRKVTIAAMLAATLGSLKFVPDFGGPRIPKQRTHVPMMVTATPGVIAAWNDGVKPRNERKGLRSKLHRKARGDNGQHQKFAKERTHKQAAHPLRDEHGAYTLTGKPYDIEGIHPTSREVVLTGWVDGEEYGYTVQRKWLGGISAQRGY